MASGKCLSVLGKHGRALSSCASPPRITANPPSVMTLHCLHARLGLKPAFCHGNCIKTQRNGHSDFRKSSVLSQFSIKAVTFSVPSPGPDGGSQVCTRISAASPVISTLLSCLSEYKLSSADFQCSFAIVSGLLTNIVRNASKGQFGDAKRTSTSLQDLLLLFSC